MSTSPHAAHIGDFTWLTEIDRRRNLIGLHATKGNFQEAHLATTLWLAPDRAEVLGRALLEAVDGWRADEQAKAWTNGGHA